MDLNGAKSGASATPGGRVFNIPRGVDRRRITPPVIHLRLEPVVKRTLPVTVRLSGKPAEGYRVTQTVAQPENVSVQGPAEEVRRLAAVETLPLDVEESRSGIKRRGRAVER